MTPLLRAVSAADGIEEGVVAPASGAGLPRFRSLGSLMEGQHEPDWLWDGFLAAGAVSMLVAPPFAGKSTLTAGLLAALPRGATFLGRATSAATAVLLTEENDEQLREKVTSFGFVEEGHSFLGRSDVFGYGWETLIAHAAEHAAGVGHRLLVVDTFPGLAGLEAEEENDAGAINKRLRPLLNAAGQGLAVLFLHHTNKLGGVRGSEAFRGAVDISIKLTRPPRQSTLTLTTESRFVTQATAKLTARLQMHRDGWTYAEERKPASRIPKGEKVRGRLLEAIEQAGPGGITYAEFDHVDGMSTYQAKRHLPRMYKDNLVDRSGAGSKTDPFRWKPAA